MSTADVMQEFRQTVTEFVNMLQTWPATNLDMALPQQQDTTCRQVLVKAIRTNYSYITQIQKYAGLPRIDPPDAVNTLGQHDLDKLRRLLDFLGPFSTEALSPLTDDQLEGKTYDFAGQNLSIKEAIEQAADILRQAMNQLEQVKN